MAQGEQSLQPFRSWSFARVLLLCVAWVLLDVVLFACWLYFQIREMEASGSAGIGAVSVGFGDSVVLTVLVLPPVVLILAWLIMRVARFITAR
jgi:hypothetical protein